ncbi:MAG: peptide ABC transporter substrate-binding protein [Micromonosporaceae bacterium]
MRGWKSARLIAVGAAVALLATACGGGGDTGDGDAGGELKVYLLEPEDLIPANTNESNGGTVLQNVYSALVKYGKDGKPVNEVAESIESSDQKVWTIKVKKGWTFHNGEPVNADSFVNAWNFAAYGPNANGNSYFFDRIEGYADMQSVDPDEDGPKKAPEPKTDKLAGLKKVDDLTFEVTLAAPFSNFALMLGYTAFYPMAKECLDDVKACKVEPIGNGPFKMDGKWERKRSIKLVKYNKYQGTKPKVDKLSFKIYKDERAGYAGLQSGEIDMLSSVPVDKVESTRSEYGDRLIEEESSAFTFLTLPQYLPEFKDEKVRKAISLAIDRKSIVKEIFADRFTAATGLVAPIVPGARSGVCEYCEADVAKAKALLKEAGGWPKGKKLELWFNAGSGHEVWMEAVGHQLKENLGIDFTLKGDLEFAEYLALGDQDKYTGAARGSWIMDYPSPENYLKPLYHTQGSTNRTGYRNKAFDKMVAEGDKASSLEAGIEKYQAAEDMVLKDMPVVPLWWGRSTLAYNDNLGNVQYNPIYTNPDYSKITVS